ncbi:hypothetical protein CCHL11_07024 [Colletotrichum chlorophyti]|uniref:Uncharacterized protein n=1 Tax=Colletotrichum chlorophyti TaxID=708187 RepID=A0A1Q8RBZ3_9PEZI|nr:hypothetical protein CCHL11_07024 [Colletotrichum chlorophyti]
MRFTCFLLVSLGAAVHNAVAAHCRIGGATRADCCWGGSDGYASCHRQNKDRVFCESDSDNYCTNVMRDGAAVSSTCDADCCNTLNGWGTGCPK